MAFERDAPKMARPVTLRAASRGRPVRILLSLIAYAVALVLVASISFVAVIFLAGPHAGLLPGWLEAVVLGLGWLAVLVIPFLVLRRVWRRLGKEPHDNSLDGTP